MVAWSDSEDPVTQRQMREFSDELSQMLNGRQQEITVKMDMADQLLKAADQQYRILEQAMGARVISLEEALQKTMIEVMEHKENIGYLKTSGHSLDSGLQEIHDALIGINSTLGPRVNESMRKAEVMETEMGRINAVLAEADRCVRD